MPIFDQLSVVVIQNYYFCSCLLHVIHIIIHSSSRSSTSIAVISRAARQESLIRAR
jgi:hypothetical protein